MTRSTPARRPITVALLIAAIAAGCTGGDAPRPAPGAGPRIVSLSPAISRTLIDLGEAGHVVGRSAWCAALDPAIPVVGDLYEIDYERLIRLEPTHVLVQPPSARGVDPHLATLAAEHGWVLGSWTIDSIEDIEDVIRALPGTIYAGEPEALADASARAATLLNDLAGALSPGGETLFAGRTLLVADADPVWVFGDGTYLDDVLAALGAENATDARGWVELSLEDVVRLAPEAIVLVRDRGPPGIDPLEAAGPLAGLETPARRGGRIAVLHHPDAKLPSSAVADVARALRRTLAALSEPRTP